MFEEEFRWLATVDSLTCNPAILELPRSKRRGETRPTRFRWKKRRNQSGASDQDILLFVRRRRQPTITPSVLEALEIQ
jgi:hypothetical protein